MKSLLILIAFIQISTALFAQTKDEEIARLNARIDSLTTELNDLKAELLENFGMQSPLSDWLKENFGIIVPPDMYLQCEFDCTNYTGKLDQSILKEFQEEYWLGTFHLNDIKSTKNGIVMDIGTDDLSKILIITEDYFTVSYHGIVGSDGQTLIYSFDKNGTTLDRDNFCYDVVSPSVLLAARDYYDSKDVEDPDYQGHIFEYGQYDLGTQKYSFIAFE